MTTEVQNTAKAKMSIICLIALILGIVGLVLMVVSNGASSANLISNFSKTIGIAVLGVALTAVLSFVKTNPLVSLVAFAGSIACFTAVLGNVLNSRLLLISALFTWDSNNMIGWKVFYLTAASVACFAVANLVLIVSAFTKD